VLVHLFFPLADTHVYNIEGIIDALESAEGGAMRFTEREYVIHFFMITFS
jgi:hypothetical protein